MSRLKAPCPSCGAEVKFRVGASLVAICEYCRTVVARTDRAIEDLGKVAELTETQSPLQLDLKGKYDGKTFTIVGRCQYQHEAGGVWDEWYCAFNNKRWGWLAEAQGRFYLTFEWKAPEGLKLPARDQLTVGRRIRLGDSLLTISETGVAKVLGAAGELPIRLEPGQPHPYVDLTGESGEFGTLDYSGTPVAYLGREVTLDEVGIGADVRGPDREAKEVGSLSVSCPHCGGALELRAPDQTQRVVCPYCSSMLDCSEGSLQYLSTLQIQGRKPQIEIGSKGTFDGVEYVILGFMTRSVTYAGVDYFWDEYLLYQPRVGFRWLVHCDDNWSFVKPLTAGEIHEHPMSLTWKGKTFKIFQRSTAEVRWVLGEFYWKVSIGEQVTVADYVAPPEMISVEDSVQFFATEGTVGAERNVSLGTYVPVAEVEKAFGISGLPRPGKIAPNQPFTGSAIYRDAALAVAGMFLLGMIFVGISSSKEVYRASLTAPSRSALMSAAASTATKPAPGQPAAGSQSQMPVIRPENAQLGAPPQTTPAGRQPQAGLLNDGSGLTQTPPQAGEEGAVFFSDRPLQLHSRQPVEITVNTSVQNSWVYVEGDLFNEETGLVQTFTVPVEYYSGYEGGESWSEGSRSNSAVVSALPEGKYTLRLEIQTGSPGPEPVSIVVEEGGFRIVNFMLALVGLLIIPACVGLWHYTFERRRWEDSDYSPYASSGDDDD